MRAHSIARTDPADVWARLAEPLRPRVSPAHGDHRSLVESADEADSNAELVRTRLDAIVPGGWELHVELQPVGETSRFVVKTRLVVLGVSREDFGEGFSLPSASDDGLTRAARRFGIGVESVGVPTAPSVPVSMGVADTPAVLSGDEEFAAVFRAEPVKRKQRDVRVAAPEVPSESPAPAEAAPSAARKSTMKSRKDSERRATISADEEFPSCPRCGDIMWDDRGAKKSADAPDFRCRRRGCVGTLWVDRSDAPPTAPAAPAAAETRDEEFPF